MSIAEQLAAIKKEFPHESYVQWMARLGYYPVEGKSGIFMNVQGKQLRSHPTWDTGSFFHSAEIMRFEEVD